MWHKIGPWVVLFLVFAVVSAGAGWLAGLFVAAALWEYRYSPRATERRNLKAKD